MLDLVTPFQRITNVYYSNELDIYDSGGRQEARKQELLLCFNFVLVLVLT